MCGAASSTTSALVVRRDARFISSALSRYLLTVCIPGRLFNCNHIRMKLFRPSACFLPAHTTAEYE